MRCLRPTFLLLLGLTATASADEFRGVGLPNREALDGTALEQLPTADSLHQVLAQQFLTALFTSEESLGYSDLEPARLTLTGNSAQWTHWRLETLQLTDPLFDGAEAFHVPWAMLASIDVANAESARNHFGGGVHLGVAPSATKPRAGVTVSFAAGGAGGMFPGAQALDHFFTGKHPLDRAEPPDADRQRLVGRVTLSAFDTVALPHGLTLRGAVELSAEERHHVSYASGDGTANGQPYEEHGNRATALLELAPEDRHWRAYLLAEFLQRDNLFAERGFTLGETQGLATGGLLAGLVAEHFRAGLTWKHYATTPVDPDFARDLNDVDGEGRFPYVPTGSMNALRLDLGAHALGFYATVDGRVLAWSPDEGTTTHALTWLGTPMGAMSVSSHATTTVIGEHRAGWAHVFEFERWEVALDGALALDHAQAKGFSTWLPGVSAKADVVAKVSRYFEPFAALGYTPVGLTSQLGLMMTPGYFTGAQTLANGQLMQTFGGEYTRVDPTLRGATSSAIALGARSHFAEKWNASVQGIGKIWHDVPKLTLDGASEQYGHFTDGVFYFDGQPTRYLLTNTPGNQTAFGGSVHIDVSRLDDGVGFFRAGFTASSFVGSPPPGNGAWANDVGVLDWNGANPNASKNAFSTLDSDRAYVLRLSGGRRLWKNLWGSFLIAFRDGQPFSFYDTAIENGQLASWMTQPRGSPLKGSSPLLGWREDFQAVIDVQLSYEVPLDARWSMRVKVIGANLFDLNNETAERQAPGGFGVSRSSLTTQLPRSVSFAVELLQLR
jgi:hypothetical protein